MGNTALNGCNTDSFILQVVKMQIQFLIIGYIKKY